MSVAPLSGYKTSEYEGGTRPPFIIKEPSTMASSSTAVSAANNHVIKSFVFVTDMRPTFLDFTHVSQPPAGSTYKGNQTHPIMGKSIKPLIDGTVDRIHGVDEPIGTEVFNSTGLYMGLLIFVLSIDSIDLF